MRRMRFKKYKIVEREEPGCTTTYYLELCSDLTTGLFMIYFPFNRTYTGGFKTQEDAIVHLGLICAERNATFEEVDINE